MSHSLYVAMRETIGKNPDNILEEIRNIPNFVSTQGHPWQEYYIKHIGKKLIKELNYIRGTQFSFQSSIEKIENWQIAMEREKYPETRFGLNKKIKKEEDKIINMITKMIVFLNDLDNNPTEKLFDGTLLGDCLTHSKKAMQIIQISQ